MESRPDGDRLLASSAPDSRNSYRCRPDADEFYSTTSGRGLPAPGDSFFDVNSNAAYVAQSSLLFCKGFLRIIRAYLALCVWSRGHTVPRQAVQGVRVVL